MKEPNQKEHITIWLESIRADAIKIIEKVNRAEDEIDRLEKEGIIKEK